MIEKDVCILMKWNTLNAGRLILQITSDLHNYFNCSCYITTSANEYKENVIGLATYHYAFENVTKKEFEEIRKQYD
jgi:hypothetical protein